VKWYDKYDIKEIEVKARSVKEKDQMREQEGVLRRVES